MSQSPQLHDDVIGEILVAVQSGHPSGFLVFLDRLINCLTVLVVIRPGGL
jgi:hypothetical protein